MGRAKRPHKRTSVKGKKFKAGRGKSISRPSDWRVLIRGDTFAEKMVGGMVSEGVEPDLALEVYVNSVDGDMSQLPIKLVKYAKRMGWLERMSEVF